MPLSLEPPEYHLSAFNIERQDVNRAEKLVAPGKWQESGELIYPPEPSPFQHLCGDADIDRGLKETHLSDLDKNG